MCNYHKDYWQTHVLGFTQTHVLCGWQVRRGREPQTERVKGQNVQIMRGFVMREALAWKTSLSVSEGDVFLSFCESVWKLLNHDQGAQNCESLGGLAANDMEIGLVGMNQKQRLKGTSLLYLHALPEDRTSTKDTHLWVASLSVYFPLNAEPWPWGPEDPLEGSNAFWSSYSSWEFSRATSEPGCHTSGAQRSIVTQSPRFRGLLRGTAEGNTECHCCKQPGASSNMIPQQIAVQLCPSTHVCSEILNGFEWTQG